MDNKYILVKRGRDVSNISVTSLSCKHRPLMKINVSAQKALTTLRRSC